MFLKENPDSNKENLSPQERQRLKELKENPEAMSELNDLVADLLGSIKQRKTWPDSQKNDRYFG